MTRTVVKIKTYSSKNKNLNSIESTCTHFVRAQWVRHCQCITYGMTYIRLHYSHFIFSRSTYSYLVQRMQIVLTISLIKKNTVHKSKQLRTTSKMKNIEPVKCFVIKCLTLQYIQTCYWNCPIRLGHFLQKASLLLEGKMLKNHLKEAATAYRSLLWSFWGA